MPLIFIETLTNIIHDLFGKDYFIVKSIYFDKPGDSNWFVSYHQDLTISVDKKIELEGFGPWTVKQNQFAVQPPLPVLESNFTIRIHLDDTDEHNGALRVIPGSHLKGIIRSETIDWSKETEITCKVKRGGIMLMRPLLLHASSRSTNNKRRRVIHIEFSNKRLPEPLQWSECGWI
jgi:Protein involved in biosynthesis of mitomycin antibiotics/polyketide fumonisin